MIYLDSAATSLYRPAQVVEAVCQALTSLGNSSRGTHTAALTGARMLFETRQMLSDLFNGDGPEQVVFTANSTESLNMAVKGILVPGDRAITTVMEHNSVLRPLYEMERQGVCLEIIGTDDLGRLDMASMKQAIDSGAKAVFCTHASNLTGNINDIRKIGGWCRQIMWMFYVLQAIRALWDPREPVDSVCAKGFKSALWSLEGVV